ncbi:MULTISPECIES: AAA family ATPase [Lactobacillus]|uniref:AAA family ATPase n=1 Tax=Lactobacillus TaxID=1578 RepID=UPI001434911C|nr:MULTISPECIES: AAA family ATPase [Lactobacillus]GFI20574.1 DNA replication and repair protein RecF [Lactobacillus johnsonii]
MRLNEVKIDKFRKLEDIDFKLGKRLTFISGVNGIGKSSLVSLIASSSGTKGSNIKRINGKNFQPEFNDYFKIEEGEEYDKYKIYIDSDEKIGNEKYNLTKRISFKNDTNYSRGIRPIPRTTAPFNRNDITIRKASEDANTGAARFSIPTIYLSLTRLMPPAESNLKGRRISSRNKIAKLGLTDYYRDCYNSVLYDSIDKKDKGASLLEKSIGGKQKKHLALKLKDSTDNTISTGQDTLGYIVGALTDFYSIKKKLGNNYEGGLLCIDEFDATLHPSAVMKLIELLDNEAQNLNLQIVVTTHSLIALKKASQLVAKNKGNEDYKLIYFMDVNVPHLLKQPTFANIKADMFGDVSIAQPTIKAFTEDEAGKKLLKTLIKANPSLTFNFEIVPLKLGGEQLIRLPNLDKVFYKRLLCPDGDKRQKTNLIPKNTEDIKISKVTEKWGQRSTSITVPNNVLVLPSIYPPEIFIYKIIEEYVENPRLHAKFWNTVNLVSDTMYTTQQVKEDLLINSETKYSDIHENKKWLAYAIKFITTTHLFEDYLKNGEDNFYFEKFYEEMKSAVDAVSKANKIALFDF